MSALACRPSVDVSNAKSALRFAPKMLDVDAHHYTTRGIAAAAVKKEWSTSSSRRDMYGPSSVAARLATAAALSGGGAAGAAAAAADAAGVKQERWRRDAVEEEIPRSPEPTIQDDDGAAEDNSIRTTRAASGDDAAAAADKNCPVPCPQCGFYFKNSSTLRSHVSSKHLTTQRRLALRVGAIAAAGMKREIAADANTTYCKRERPERTTHDGGDDFLRPAAAASAAAPDPSEANAGTPERTPQLTTYFKEENPQFMDEEFVVDVKKVKKENPTLRMVAANSEQSIVSANRDGFRISDSDDEMIISDVESREMMTPDAAHQNDRNPASAENESNVCDRESVTPDLSPNDGGGGECITPDVDDDDDGGIGQLRRTTLKKGHFKPEFNGPRQKPFNIKQEMMNGIEIKKESRIKKEPGSGLRQVAYDLMKPMTIDPNRSRILLPRDAKIAVQKSNPAFKSVSKLLALPAAAAAARSSAAAALQTRRPSFPCSQCNRKLESVGSLQRHMKQHEIKSRNIRCDRGHCRRYFAFKGNLHKHIMNVHENNHAHKCTHCGKGFGTKASLVSHVSKVHSKIGNNGIELTNVVVGGKQCFDCGLTFATAIDLNNHVRLHGKSNGSFVKHAASAAAWVNSTDGNKYHECRSCGKKFVYKSTLDKHTAKLHGSSRPWLKPEEADEDERRPPAKSADAGGSCESFQCQLCVKRFIYKFTLAKHLKAVHDGLTVASPSSPPSSSSGSDEDESPTDTLWETCDAELPTPHFVVSELLTEILAECAERHGSDLEFVTVDHSEASNDSCASERDEEADVTGLQVRKAWSGEPSRPRLAVSKIREAEAIARTILDELVANCCAESARENRLPHQGQGQARATEISISGVTSEAVTDEMTKTKPLERVEDGMDDESAAIVIGSSSTGGFPVHPPNVAAAAAGLDKSTLAAVMPILAYTGQNNLSAASLGGSLVGDRDRRRRRQQQEIGGDERNEPETCITPDTDDDGGQKTVFTRENDCIFGV